MSKEVFRIWCEWDIGHEDLIFTSEVRAIEWLEDNLNLQEVMEDRGYENLDKVFDLGLVSLESSYLD